MRYLDLNSELICKLTLAYGSECVTKYNNWYTLKRGLGLKLPLVNTYTGDTKIVNLDKLYDYERHSLNVVNLYEYDSIGMYAVSMLGCLTFLSPVSCNIRVRDICLSYNNSLDSIRGQIGVDKYAFYENMFYKSLYFNGRSTDSHDVNLINIVALSKDGNRLIYLIEDSKKIGIASCNTYRFIYLDKGIKVYEEFFDSSSKNEAVQGYEKTLFWKDFLDSGKLPKVY